MFQIRRNGERHIAGLGHWALLVFCVGAAASTLAGQGNQVPGSAPVTILNDATRPVPIAGEVSASISGSVEVSRLPDTFTGQIGLLLDRLNDLLGAASAPGHPRANYARTFRYDLPATGGITLPDPPTGNEHFILDRTVWASFVTISTENDDGWVQFYSDPALCCDAENAVLRFGHDDRQLPDVITVPLPQAVPLRSIRFFCTNNVENCEVAISIVGTADQ